MPTKGIKLHIMCKNCGKLFTLSKPREFDDEAGFADMDRALDIFRQWRDTGLDLFITCPSCKRAYQYTSTDIFIVNPLYAYPEATSIVPPPSR